MAALRITDMDITDTDITEMDITDMDITDVDITDVDITDVDITDVDICDLGPDNRECPICREALQLHENKKTAAQLTCGHAFGRECIISWLQIGTTCPMCRATVIEIPEILETPRTIGQMELAELVAIVRRNVTEMRYLMGHPEFRPILQIARLMWLCVIIYKIWLRWAG